MQHLIGLKSNEILRQKMQLLEKKERQCIAELKRARFFFQRVTLTSTERFTR